MIWGILAALTIASLLAIGLGIRGRRFGSAPHCRWCNSGVPDTTASNCESCGGSLTVRHGVKRGRWRRMPVLIALGVLGALADAALVTAVLKADDPGWNRALPTGLLLQQARLFHASARNAAADELLRRHEEEEPLSPAQFAAIAPVALTTLRDRPNSTWERSAWWALFSAASQADAVDHDTMAGLLEELVGELDLELPDRRLAGEFQGGQWGQLYPRPAQDPTVIPTAGLSVVVSLRSASFDDEPLQLDMDSHWDDRWTLPYFSYRTAAGGRGRGSSSGSRSGAIPTGQLPNFAIAPGAHKLVLRWRVHARPSSMEEREPMSWAAMERGERPPDPPAITEADFPYAWDVETVSEFAAFATAEEMIRLVGPEDGYSIDPGSITAEFRVNEGWVREGNGPRKPSYSASLSIDRRGDGEAQPWIIGRVELRSGDDAWPLREYPARWSGMGEGLQHVALQPTDGFGSYGYSHGLRLLPDIPRSLKAIDLVIIPDIQHAAEVQRTGEIWGEEVVIKDVPLDWSELDLAFPPREEGEPDADSPSADGDGG